MDLSRLTARLEEGSTGPSGPASSAFTYDEAKRLAAHPDPEVRRELAARADVVPEILYFLSADPDPEVRRRIAANAGTPRQADYNLAHDKDAEVRAGLARKIARLAPGLSPDERDRVRAMTYETLSLLARDQAPTIRRILAEALKSEAKAPREVIARLARDIEIIVAAPILEFSPILTDEDLLDIIRASPVAGTLSAIARRGGLSSDVSDVIAGSADTEAIADLLGNDSAQLREETLDAMVARARATPRLREPLVRRANLPHGAARRLATFIADNLLQVLAQRRDLPPETVSAVRRVVHDRLKATKPALPVENRDSLEIEAEYEKARLLRESGQLDEDLIRDAIGQNHLAFARAAIGVRADLGPEVVARILGSASPKAVTALCWRAGLSMEATTQAQVRLARINPDMALHGVGRRYPLTDGEMAMQIAIFSND
ncbi:conserved hypothetical protein [uncultured Alphaproteobacteria bacterium]|uniref:DUF2336 domain-containing protein n=1 Tax=uncultured Alphaproteobacteria bacterium TaxID=91750 RepID=A0A212K621_9PROT|nr:conserved hypothetical protein [uncultured Alphaproteobacteria bacterium]